MDKEMMIKLLILSMLFVNVAAFGQNENHLKLNLELDLVQPILKGYGATIGIEYERWGAGMMGFK